MPHFRLSLNGVMEKVCFYVSLKTLAGWYFKEGSWGILSTPLALSFPFVIWKLYCPLGTIHSVTPCLFYISVCSPMPHAKSGTFILT